MAGRGGGSDNHGLAHEQVRVEADTTVGQEVHSASGGLQMEL